MISSTSVGETWNLQVVLVELLQIRYFTNGQGVPFVFDHVLDPVDDDQIASLVEIPDVAGPIPTRAEHTVPCCFLIVLVTPDIATAVSWAQIEADVTNEGCLTS